MVRNTEVVDRTDCKQDRMTAITGSCLLLISLVLVPPTAARIDCLIHSTAEGTGVETVDKYRPDEKRSVTTVSQCSPVHCVHLIYHGCWDNNKPMFSPLFFNKILVFNEISFYTFFAGRVFDTIAQYFPNFFSGKPHFQATNLCDQSIDIIRKLLENMMRDDPKNIIFVTQRKR